MKILIIDDDPDINRLFCTSMNCHGHESIRACSGKEGLMIARRDQLDLIVLDIMMPEMGGWEVLRRLRHDKSTEKTPVIIWSAMSGHRHKEKARSLGAQEYVSKGCGLDKLVSIICGISKCRGQAPASMEDRKNL